MYLRKLCAALLLLPLSGFVAADAYKCDPEKGYVSYQEHECPKSDSQSIVRIYRNSHHIDYNAKEKVHPLWDELVKIDRERELAARLQAEKRAAKAQEQIETAALQRDMEEQARCEKYTALYHERVRLQSVKMSNAETGELHVDILNDAMEMIESTRATMEAHCRSLSSSSVDLTKPLDFGIKVNGPR